MGDDAQAIYAFRGADPAHLRELGEHYPDLEVVRLGRNYRSKTAVLTLANTVRPQSPGLELALTSDRGPGSRPQLVRCHDEATQAREICTRVLAAHEAGVDLRDQAVLMRAAGHSDVLEVELSVRGIPFIKYGGLRFTEAAHVKDFLAAARVVANPADDIAWFRVLRLHEGVGPVHAGRVVDALRLAEADPLSRWAEAAAAIPAKYREAVTATLSALAGAAALEKTADRATAILAALDAPLRGRYPDAGVRLNDLGRLADAAATRPSLHDALVELALDPPVSASDLAGPPRLDEDYLILSTIHSAKGLEWPVVHLMHLVDGAVPSDMALGSPDGAGRGAAAVLRGGHPGPGRAVPVRAAADAPAPDVRRRPAWVRAADPVPHPGRAGGVRAGGRHPAGAGAAHDRAAVRHRRRGARLAVRPGLRPV